jgi:protein ImuB
MTPGAMRYAVIRAKDFALQALLRVDPALAGRPVAIVCGEGRKSVVTEVSAEAGGVGRGVPATLALARCPGIVLRSRDPSAEVEAQRLLIAAAFSLAPRVESTAPGACTVDLQGADPDRAWARAQALAAELAMAGLEVTVGFGRTPLLSSHAAEYAGCTGLSAANRDGPQSGEPTKPGAGVKTEAVVAVLEDERVFLSVLPLAAASPSPPQAEILARWGLRTCGELAALPKGGIGARLGAEGVALWERAAGEATRVLRPVEPAKTFAAEWDYEPPVESVEPLLFRLRRFAERIALELRGAGFVAERITLTLLMEDETDYRREFRLPEPGADIDGWMRVLAAHLGTVRMDSRISGARLAASPARPPEKQDGLFDMGLRDPQAFWENLARLGAIVGPDRVGTPVPVDSHRLDAFALEKPQEAVPPPEGQPLHPQRGPALRRFRPARPLRVEWDGSRPRWLEAGDLRGAVAACRGPWLESGDWWKPDRWAREIWCVELAGGGLYQIARTAAGWVVEGMLD